ncbi:MAG: hypothetical protein ACRCU0_07240 [Candidatus Rhabdochlamydia sp.]
MSNPIGIATKCVTTFLDFLHIVEAVNECDESDPSLLQVANVINRLASFGFSATEIKKLTCNPSNNHALACLKNSELTNRYFTLLIQVFKGPKHSETQTETELQFLERAVILPISDIVRVSAEKSGYEIRHCLNNPLELTPASSTDSSLETILGCKKKLTELEGRISSAFKMKMISEFGLVNSAGAIYKKFYEKIYARAFGHLFLNRQYDDPQALAETILNSFPIPAAFHDDVVLRRYICPITLEPIRYPVQDPTTLHRQQDQNNPTLYEKSAIINSLMVRPLSPMTRDPLTADQLIDRPDIQFFIEDRLRDHSSRLWAYLEASPLLQQQLQIESNSP